MMIDRRTFIIQGATLLATAPAFGVMLPHSSAAQAPLMTEVGAGENSAVFKIHGWDHYEGEASNENEVWITINQSWRAAWR